MFVVPECVAFAVPITTSIAITTTATVTPSTS